MKPYVLSLILALLAAAALLGCSPGVVPTSHNYALAHGENGRLVAYDGEAPIYERFEREVMSDAYLKKLVNVFENTTSAYLATNMRAHSQRRTIANHLVIVLDSRQAGALQDVTIRAGSRNVPVEIALGLGQAGEIDLAAARQEFAGAIGPVLLALAGVKVSDLGPPQAELSQPTSPSQALGVGFSLALQALHADELSEQSTDAGGWAETLAFRAQAIRENAYGAQRTAATADESRHGRDEAMCTPGTVGTFLYRLLQRADGYYPQRYMLWFANYEPEEFPYAKLLLAARRMSQADEPSIDSLIESYAETFPAEQDTLRQLADTVLGRHE